MSRGEAEDDFPDEMPEQLRGKLAGLWGWGDDKDVFRKLPLDKREALLLLADRLNRLDLWQAVGRIVNVYGTGGVGMYFCATLDLERTLDGRADFTKKFARHRDNSGGFLEKGRRHGSLHFLYIDVSGGEREWHVHLDLYGPMGSVITAAQHLYYERWRKFRPDWRIMKSTVSSQSSD